MAVSQASQQALQEIQTYVQIFVQTRGGTAGGGGFGGGGIKHRVGAGDIGVFDTHTGSPGIHYLTASPNESSTATDTDQIHSIIDGLGGDLDATFEANSKPFSALSAAHCRALVQFLDEKFVSTEDADLKVPLTRSQLAQLIGKGAMKSLQARFPLVSNATEIKLRRCSAVGQCINFHTDHAFRTMQIPLNGDDEYKGGKLVFCTREGLVFPPRPAGGATTHDYRIVHGVTTLHRGTRYGLFFLSHPKSGSAKDQLGFERTFSNKKTSTYINMTGVGYDRGCR